MQVHGVGGWVLAAAVVFTSACDSQERRPDGVWAGVDGEARGHGQFVVGDEIEDIEYELVDGLALHQGDILLGRADTLTAWERGEDVELSATTANNRWPEGIVPYAIDPAIDDEARAAFLAGVDEVHALTNVLLVERDDEEDYVFVTSSNEGCYASLGAKHDGTQSLNLGSGCRTKGVALHEIGHALGLYHEQARADRDQYVAIEWDNIRDDKDSQFKSYAKTGKGEDVGPYDFDSIMHYKPQAFGIYTDDGKLTTIIAKDGRSVFGQRERLSAGDIGGIARMYGPRSAPLDCAIVLRPGEFMGRSEAHTSCNGRFRLELRQDGDFALMQGSTRIGHTDTNAGHYVGMSWHGEFGVFSQSYSRLWGMSTGQPQAYLVLQDDGEFLVLSPSGATLWTSETAVE